MKKKILSIILVLSMLCAFMPVIANAADDMPIQMTTATITKSETDTTYNFDVAAAEKYENCYVYAAIYAYDNTLLEVKRVPLNTTDNTSVSVSKSPYNVLVKVFIWSDNMQPVIEAKDFTLTPTATLPPRPTATPTPKPTPTPTPKPTATPTPTPKPPSNVTWSLNEATGTLTISGIGDMKDYSYSSVPWDNKRDSIKSVVIENGVTSIGNFAFYYCTGLTSVTIPDSVTSIGNYAFYNCTGLKDVYIPDNVTSIGNEAFRGCSGLTSVTIPDSVTSIGYAAFRGCSSLASVTIGNSVKNIGNYAFEDCRNITTLNYNASTVFNAFSSCSNLILVVLGDNVTNIDTNAFANRTKLETIIIPKSVTEIESGAFENCSALTTVKYCGNEAEWQEMYIGSTGNDHLKNANIVFDYVVE